MDENETPKPDQFTIRVYGILIDAAKGVLVADEIHKGSRYTKFPGGGLEPGEGTVDCLKREWMEELQKPIEIIRHFYTTDFFQRSAFDKKVQVISIYYLVRQPGEAKISISKHPFELNEDAAFGLSFRWIRKAFFQPALFSLPIDKLVAQMILEKKML